MILLEIIGKTPMQKKDVKLHFLPQNILNEVEPQDNPVA